MYRVHGVLNARGSNDFVKSRMFDNINDAEHELARLKKLFIVCLCNNGDYAVDSKLFRELVIEKSIGDVSGIDNASNWEKLR